MKKTICRHRTKGDSIDSKTPTFTNVQGVGAGTGLVNTLRMSNDDGISDETGRMKDGLANGD